MAGKKSPLRTIAVVMSQPESALKVVWQKYVTENGTCNVPI